MLDRDNPVVVEMVKQMVQNAQDCTYYIAGKSIAERLLAKTPELGGVEELRELSYVVASALADHIAKFEWKPQ